MPNTIKLRQFSAHTPVNPNPFATKAIERLRVNLSWLSSAVAAQSLLSARLGSPPETEAQLSEISKRLDSISQEIGGDCHA